MMLVAFVACVGAVPATTPQWEVVSVATRTVIGSAESLPHGIYQGFETGFYFKVNDTYYYSATELGLCKGIVWDHTTRAGVYVRAS